jgi:transposase-like protein
MQGERVNKRGLTRNGKQRYWCRDCKRTLREFPQSHVYSKELKEEILRTSLRGLPAFSVFLVRP